MDSSPRTGAQNGHGGRPSCPSPWGGSDRDLQQLVSRNERAVHRYFQRRTDAEGADDLVGEWTLRLVAAWRNPEKSYETQGGSFDSLAWTFARNVLRDRLRRAPAAARALEDVSTDAGDPERSAAASELVRDVRRRLERLPDRQRTALVLSAHGASRAEVAGVLGCSLESAYNLVSRARGRLLRDGRFSEVAGLRAVRRAGAGARTDGAPLSGVGPTPLEALQRRIAGLSLRARGALSELESDVHALAMHLAPAQPLDAAALLEQWADRCARALYCYPVALRSYDRSMGLLRAAGAADAQARVSKKRGNAFLLAGEGRSALRAYGRAERLFRRRSDREGRARARWGMASVYRGARLHRRAVREYSTALRDFEAIGHDEGVAHVLLNRGTTLLAAGHAEAGLRDYTRSACLFEQRLDAWLGLGLIANGRANAYRRPGRNDDAARGYEEAVHLIATGGDDLHAAIAASNLAEASATLGRLDDALHHFRAAARFFVAVGDRPRLARVRAKASRSGIALDRE